MDESDRVSIFYRPNRKHPWNYACPTCGAWQHEILVDCTAEITESWKWQGELLTVKTEEITDRTNVSCRCPECGGSLPPNLYRVMDDNLCHLHEVGVCVGAENTAVIQCQVCDHVNSSWVQMEKPGPDGELCQWNLCIHCGEPLKKTRIDLLQEVKRMRKDGSIGEYHRLMEFLGYKTRVTMEGA